MVLYTDAGGHLNVHTVAARNEMYCADIANKCIPGSETAAVIRSRHSAVEARNDLPVVIVEREQNVESVCGIIELKCKACAIPDCQRLAGELACCFGIHGDQLDITEPLAVFADAYIGA